MTERQVLADALDGIPLPAGPAAHTLVDLAIAERVAAPLAKSPAAAMLDVAARERLADFVRADTARTAALDAELIRVFKALDADGVAPLVMKGAHLAHAVYRQPWLRARSDTDLLIAPDERDRVAAVLGRRGYVPSAHVRGRLILGQFHFERIDGSGIAHYLDVHWRVAAPLLIERVLPARTFFDTAKPLPALGPHARVPDAPHALLLACVHLVAHHRANPILLWLYDLRLLAAALDDDARDAFAGLAARTGCCAIAVHALAAAREWFECAALDDLSARVHARMPRHEPSAALLRIRRPAGALWLDLRTAGWRDRATLLREHLLPGPSYMASRRGPLPVAYALRAAGGLRRWVTRNS